MEGYIRVCADHAVVSVREDDGGKRLANRGLPGKGLYFLDDKFVGYGGCDVVTCSHTDGMQVQLVEYQSLGTRPRPPDSGGSGQAPVFRTVPLLGTIDITLGYFADAACSVPKTFSQTLTVR